MTDREVMQQALEALEGLFGLPNQWESGGVAVWRLGGSDASRQAMHALRTALEQPEQLDKPSASFNEWWDSDSDSKADSANPFRNGSAAYWAWAGWQAAQRPWVGLTEDEILEAAQIDGADTWLFATAYAIEAKLKERNA